MREVAWGKGGNGESALIRKVIWNFLLGGLSQRCGESSFLAKQGKSDHDARGMLA